ncbi:MAG TPA: PAS domain S-box protein, partial [Spirochaetota bacterium]|nr:PAS domain S-box protein [Spirochaetota bacterium]
MRLLDTMLAAYGDERYILQLKARFLLNIHAAIITAILIVLGYSTYFHMNNPFVGNAVDPGIFGVTAGALLLVLACAVLLIRGHFTQSAHITVVGLFIAVWAGMILDDTETLTRLDTAVLAIAAISCSPLLVTRRSRVILFYSIINLAAFYAYMFYYRAELNLSATAFYSHLADNTVAFFIIGISSYNVFTITARAMEKLEENSEKLARTCMELQAATEDLEAANEEFEAQNEELVRSEEELLQSHATLESFVNALPEPTFLIDGERRLLAVNTAFLSRSGMTRQEVLGRNVIALTGAGNAEHFDACFREGKSAVFESNTGERHFVNYVYPVLNQKGRTSRAAVFSIDITQRKNTEARLLREKMFTSTMLDTLPGIFFMLDRDGNFIRWKGLGKTETTFGYRTDELLTMNALDIVDEKERAALAEKMEEVFMHGHASAEIAISARDGGITHYHLSGSRMVLGSDMYLIGIGTDITDRKRAEEER